MKMKDVFEDIFVPLGFKKNKKYFYKIENGLFFVATHSKIDRYRWFRYFMIYPLYKEYSDYEFKNPNFGEMHEILCYDKDIGKKRSHSEPIEMEELCEFSKREIENLVVPLIKSIHSCEDYLSILLIGYMRIKVNRFIPEIDDALLNILLQSGTQEQFEEINANERGRYNNKVSEFQKEAGIERWDCYCHIWESRNIEEATKKNNELIEENIVKLYNLGFK